MRCHEISKQLKIFPFWVAIINSGSTGGRFSCAFQLCMKQIVAHENRPPVLQAVDMP